MSSLIELTDITKTYKTGEIVCHALENFSLSIEKGEMVALMGTSGAGKSTAMNIIGLLDRPTSGKYILNDHAVESLSNDEQAAIRNREIGFVFQSFFLLPRLNALQNVMLPLLYRSTPNREAKKIAGNIIDKLNISELKTRKPSEMSGGQQQRVAIARALVGNPNVVLADEPTGALDSATSREVLNLFTRLNKEENRTIIVVTHDAAVGAQCKRVVILKDGKTQQEIFNEEPGIQNSQKISDALTRELHNTTVLQQPTETESAS